MMNLFRDLPIRMKLSLLLTLITTTVLALACTTFIWFDIGMHRQQMLEILTVRAQLFAEMSKIAITEGQQQQVAQALQTFASFPEIAAAIVLLEDGSELAHFSRDRQQPAKGCLLCHQALERPADLPAADCPHLRVTPPSSANQARADDRFSVFVPIMADGVQVGTVCLLSSGRNWQKQRYSVMAVIVLVSSSLLALVLSSVFHSAIFKPIRDLVATAEKITVRQDYSLRASPRGRSEIGHLVSRFNEMVERIQQHEGELRRSEEQYRTLAEAAERASRSKSLFLSNISHEIRTPLNGVIGFAEIILASSSIDDAHEQARIILRESESLMALINDLVDHAKIEAGHMELEHQPFNLRVLMARIVSTAQVQARSRSLRIGITIDDAVPQYVVGDALRIRQVLVNLVGNAIRFTSEGSITIEVEQVQRSAGISRIRFSITTPGVGIKEEDQRAILESFGQEEASQLRRFSGSGLGTTISRQLVQLMGGRIGLESESGRSNTFWFWVPLGISHGPLEQADQTMPEEVRLRPGRILLAEDYLPNQRVACRHLESASHEVVCVNNGEEAIAACKEDEFDLILMDVQMPLMDGLEATRLIRTGGGACADTPIIGLTAHADEEAGRACQEAGMDDVIVKPIRRRPFLSFINQWLTPPDEADRPVTADEDGDGGEGEAEEATPIDLQRVVRELAGDRALAHAAITAFLQDVERQLTCLQQELAANHFESLYRKAHGIRGCAEKLTAFPLATAAELLETFSESGMSSDAAAALVEVERRFARLREFVAASDLSLSADQTDPSAPGT